MIISNNKYTVFINNMQKFNSERLENYLESLESVELLIKYEKIIFENIEFLNTLKPPIKIFFPANVDDYIKEGKKYFNSKIFNGVKTINIAGVEHGVPFDINMNSKKQYINKNDLPLQAPIVMSREAAYKRKLFYDILNSCARENVDKIYVKNGIIHKFKIGEICGEENLNGAEFIQFFLNSKGSICVTNRERWIIGNFELSKTIKIELFSACEKDKNIIYVRQLKELFSLISNLFFNNQLYDFIVCEEENIKNYDLPINIKGKIMKARGIYYSWFILGCYPNKATYLVIKASFIAIATDAIGNNTTKDAERLSIIKALDYLFE